MKTMTFQARELKEALAKVRQHLGPDALILSTKEVTPLFGIGKAMLEVTAAVPELPAHKDEQVPQAPRVSAYPAPFGRASVGAMATAEQAPASSQAARLFNRVGGSKTDPGLASRRTGINRKSARDEGPAGPDEYGENFLRGAAAARAGRRPSPPSEGVAAETGATLDARLIPLQREVRALRSQLYQVTQGAAALATPALKQEIDELRAMIRTMNTHSHKGEGVSADAAYLINLGVERARAEALVSRAREVGGEPTQALRRVIAERVLSAGPVGISARVAAFVGPTGVGKTTTIAKIAARAALIDGAKVTLITIDTFRVGAIDQLQRYADLMELPLHVAGTNAALKAAVQSNQGADLILVDTAGRGPRDVAQLAALREVLDSAQGVETHLCLSATTRGREQALAVQSYLPLNPTRLCFTKLDEALGLGEILNIQESSRLPISYFGIGQKVPEDLELCTPEGFAARLLAVPKGTQTARSDQMGGRT